MTLDEAIKHCEEIAEGYERMEDSHDDKLREECLQCATDHRQLAEWLTELKERRAADVQPVKRGKWSKQMLFDDGFGGGRVGYICSACGKYVPVKGNFCSECGAKMDGGADDENSA